MAEGDLPATPVVDSPERVPGALALLGLLVFRPIDLHYRLREAGIRSPAGRIGQLWREQAEGGRAAGAYVARMLLLLVVLSPTLTVLAGLGLRLMGVPMRGVYLVSAALCSAVGLLVALVSGLASGVLLGSLASVSMLAGLHATAGGAFGPEHGGGAAMTVGLCLGIVSGLSAGSIGGLSSGRGPSVRNVQVAAIATSLVPMLVWSSASTASFAGAVAASALVAFLTCAFRLPFYALEVLAQAVAYAVERFTGKPTLRWVPVRHHNLSYLPHPFLSRHLALAVRSRPAEVLAVADACLRSPGNILVGWPWVVEALERAHAQEASAGPQA
ncbi:MULTISPECIES: hypothetical protein [unclassified Corallococcus]|uniref:hypothetical protein n=1 Tax=unclassified Corallococcus TaxID=2685029 RepID=UPI001A901C06|nr:MULTISPECIES: hypothetical protein [unclassified Corallococcus]MBN9685260.1 hypothetical protein [Corallococcus sp. NCSPR001]WAS83285.1 hypothetical protein O0N60_28705 [Corallococcus sp. NCRR]